ncbi:hypothetical protein, partial [Burkholderia anthina]|uniref:hypothetical protein n=1 Tax=Burkholderia anthina TaxID=179879 RepID=UPI001ABA510E
RFFQIVNNFFNCFVATAGVQLRVRQGFATTSTAPLPFFPRAVFPLARKRRDSMHPPPSPQALCENILKKPPCAAAHGGLGYDGPQS